MRGLVLLAKGERVVFIEDVAVTGGEDDFRGDGDEVAGGLAGGAVVRERGGSLGEDDAGQGGIGICGGVCGSVEDLVAGAGVELADDGLGEGELCVEGLGARGESRDEDGADVGRQVSSGANGVVVTCGDQGPGEEERGDEEESAHGLKVLSHRGLWGEVCKWVRPNLGCRQENAPRAFAREALVRGWLGRAGLAFVEAGLATAFWLEDLLHVATGAWVNG